MNGQPLTLELQPRLEAALASLRAGSGRHCLSDFSFSNLFLFRAAHDYRWIPGAWPCVSGRAYDGVRLLMPLFDLGRAPLPALRALLPGHDGFYPVPHAVVQRLDERAFEWHQSADDADYLYPAGNFLHYPGRALANKRNQVRQLLATTRPSHEVFRPGLADAARVVLRAWMLQKGKASGQADEAGCLEALEYAERFRLEGFVHFDQGQPIGFVLAQELQPQVFAMRFAKGLDSHAGIYPYMFQHFCGALGRPVTWLNFEQDMGLAGFRQSKQSFQPSVLLPKWRVRLREPA